jgi:pyruvate/2-oxoglutarate dehydrogenase complex dihydrolipoamide acyltransferase (E2) component
MAVEVTLPEIGEDIEHATVNLWHFKEGEKINEGDDLVELQTDSAIINIPSPTTGVLLEILVEEGDIAEIGEALATIDEE